MTTLTTILVLLAIAALFLSSYQIAFGSSSSNDSSGSSEAEPRVATDAELNSCLNHLIGIPLLSVILGWAITTDLAGVIQIDSGRQYVLITSLVMIGVSSILSLYVRWKRQGGTVDNIVSINRAGVIGWIVWMISLLASILGIISFYLDYLN